MAKIKIDADLAIRMLNADEALDLLEIHLEKKKKRVHTMQKFAFGVMGCDMDLTTVKQRLKLCKDAEIFISDVVGGHGVVFVDHVSGGWLFLATDRVKYDAINKLKRIK